MIDIFILSVRASSTLYSISKTIAYDKCFLTPIAFTTIPSQIFSSVDESNVAEVYPSKLSRYPILWQVKRCLFVTPAGSYSNIHLQLLLTVFVSLCWQFDTKYDFIGFVWRCTLLSRPSENGSNTQVIHGFINKLQ